jgi:phosphoribosyl-ATP pyrophosphohydrolase/phosphoribosyl-AMP cyclohydrolase
MTREPDFSKSNGLLPAVVQHASTGDVLMLGYMNSEAYNLTRRDNRVTFFSRSRGSLWLKGETSGSFLNVVSLAVDCDGDSILVKAIPDGPVCHTGTQTCFGNEPDSGLAFLASLSQTIRQRNANPQLKSYTSQLFAAGVDRLAQKVGEEAIEVVIEAKNGNDTKLLDESADLLFHLMVLLESRNLSLARVADTLRLRAEASA